jgi:hypothetical protein
VNHTDRIELPYGCTNRDQRYTMADPEHPESLAVRRRISTALTSGGPRAESVTLTRAEAMTVVWLLDEYHRIAVGISTTKDAVGKLRALRAALRARREAPHV